MAGLTVSESYIRDEHGRCPRCGRPMSRCKLVGDGDTLALQATEGAWGYLPDSSKLRFFYWEEDDARWVRCGEGRHFIITEDWRPELDGPFPGYGEAAPELEAVEAPRVGPIYSDYDEEVGF